MQFKELGSLFEEGQFNAVLNGKYKKKSSISDMDNLSTELFNKQMKINTDGVSEFTMAQIRAKAAAMDLNDSLTSEVVAMAKDADFTAKAATGKLKWKDVIKDTTVDNDILNKSLKKTGKVSEEDLNWAKSGSDITIYRSRLMGLVDDVDGLADSFIDLGTETSKTSSIWKSTGNYFKGLYASIKPLLPVMAGVAAAFATFKAIDYVTHGFTRASEAAETAATDYSNAKSKLENLNSEYDTQTQKIQELQALKNNGTITMTQEIELENLQNQNSELERQIDLQQNLVDIKASASAKAAETAANTEQSYVEAMQEEYGTIKGWFMGLSGYMSYTDTDGMPTTAVLEWEKENQGVTTIQGQAEANIKKLNDYKEELKDVETQLAEKGNETNDALLNRQKVLTDNITDTTNEIGTQADIIKEWIAQSTDENGTIIRGAELNVDSWNKTLTAINNIGKSQKEIDLSNLNTYFSSSNGSSIKRYLDSIVKSSGSAEEALNKFKSTGLKLSDIDVSEEGFIRYFNDLKKSAEDASKSINDLNNNLTIKDVNAAFESENAGDTYVSMYDDMKKAYELYEQGLTGTDDFKTMGEFLSYDRSNGNVDAFIRDYERVQRYFTEDDDGNLTGAGINNFLTDLQNKGSELAQNNPAKDYAKSWANWDDQSQKWTFDIDNTAEAAKELGISVQSFEAILGRIKDYDNVGDFNFHSALEDFDNAKTSLEGLEEILDGMSDGNKSKEALSKNVESWKSQLDLWENDLSTLDTDIVMNIKLEYNLAEIQSQIDEIKERGSNGGNLTRDDYATLITLNEQKHDTLSSGVGLDVKGVEIPAQIKLADSSVEEARENLQSAIESGDEKTVISAQVKLEAAQSSRNEILDEFKNWNLEQEVQISADSSIEEINSQWQRFLSENSDNEIVTKFTADTTSVDSAIDKVKQGEALQKFVELVGLDEASYLVTIWNTLQADPKFTQLSAQDQASQVIEYWNSLSPEEKQAVINATMTAEDKATATISDVDGSINSMNLDPSVNIGAVDGASSTILNVSSALANLDGTTAHTYIVTHKTETGGKGNLLGTAHKDGTAGLYPIPKLSGRALALGSLSDTSWLKPNWKTKKDEVSLTGELGQELVVSGNRWWTVGDNGAEFSDIPKGAIVFNADQTKELLNNGFTNSRGSARVSGTAYAGGANGSFNFSGGASVYNPPSSGSSYDYVTPDPAPAQAVAKATEEAADAADDFSEELDHIQTKLDRVERAIKNIKLVADSTYETFATRSEALHEEISATIDEISTQQAAYDRYLQQADSISLSQDYMDKIADGAIDIETITDKDLNETIKSYQEWYEKALDCRDAINELKESVRELYEEAFENVEKRYDNILDQIESRHNLLEGYIDQTEAKGYLVSQKYYEALIESERNSLSSLTEKRTSLINSLNTAMSDGTIQEYSDSWYEMQSAINDVDEAIQKADTSIIEYGNSIRELQWDVFDKIQDSISSITGEADFLVKLMSSKDLYDNKGTITDQGKASMGMHGVNYNTYMSQADAYKKAIASLDEEISRDPYNQDLIDRRKELLELQQKAITSAQDEKEAIRDLVEDGIKKQLDALRDLIDEYTDALDSQKDMYDYQKKIADYQEKIGLIQKQIASYSNDDSEEGRANKQKAQNELKEAKENMEDTQYERSISDQKKLLDELYTEYEEVLNLRLDNLDQLVMDVIANINSDSAGIRDTIVNEANNVGYQISDSMRTIWGEGNNAITNGVNGITSVITMYGNNFTNAVTGVQTAINNIRVLIQDAVNASNKSAAENINKVDNAKKEQTTPPPAPAPSPAPKPINNGGDGVARVNDVVTLKAGECYYYDSWGTNPAGDRYAGVEKGVIIDNYSGKEYGGQSGSHGEYGVHIRSADGKFTDLGWVKLSQLKGYKTGTKGTKKDELAYTHDDEIMVTPDGGLYRQLDKGTMVIPKLNSDNIWNWSKHDPREIFGQSPIANVNTSAVSQPVNNDIQINIEIDKVQDYNDFVRQLQKDQKFEKLIQNMTIGRVNGGSKLSKYTIKF